MATTPPFNFLLRDYFVDIENVFPSCSATIFETKLNGEQGAVEATFRYANEDKTLSFLFFRSEKDLRLRVVGVPAKVPLQFIRTRNEQMQDGVEYALTKGTWGYIFQLDACELNVEGYWLYLDSDRTSGCWWRKQTREVSANHFRVKPDFSNLVADLANPDSGVRFALRWEQLSPKMQFQIATDFARGDAEELHKVVEALTVHEELGLQSRHTFYATDMGRFVSYMGAIKTNSAVIDCGPPPITPLVRWLGHVYNYFGVSINEELSRKYPCVPTKPPWISIKLSPPTHHERLEAALFLREWAKDKIPTGELRLLLPTL